MVVGVFGTVLQKTGLIENQRKNEDNIDHFIDRLDRLEYPEESWRPEETCSYSDSSERLPVKAGGVLLL